MSDSEPEEEECDCGCVGCHKCFDQSTRVESVRYVSSCDALPRCEGCDDEDCTLCKECDCGCEGCQICWPQEQCQGCADCRPDLYEEPDNIQGVSKTHQKEDLNERPW